MEISETERGRRHTVDFSSEIELIVDDICAYSRST